MLQKIDLMIFGAHPDDAEIAASGLLLLMKKKGYKTGIVDLTRGEMASAGNVEQRQEEAQKAAKILNLDLRLNLEMKDCYLEDNHASRSQVVEVIRKYQVDYLVAPYWHDKHPDHEAAGKILKAAYFLARLKKYSQTGADVPHSEFYSPRAIFYYPSHDYFQPQLVIDITDVFQTKMSAIKAYQSQFAQPITDPNYRYAGITGNVDFLEARARHYGSLIRVPYGEGFIIEDPIEFRDLKIIY